MLLLLACAAGARAQVPGVPFPAPANARSSLRLLPTVSLESGVYRHRTGWVVPLAIRGGLDRGPVSVTVGAAPLFCTSGGRPGGFGAGASLAFRLWRHGDTYFSPGGRVVLGAGYSRFAPDVGAATWQLDLPVALAFAHRLPPPRFAILPWVAPRVQPRIRHDGTQSDLRWVAGGSAGVEVAKTLCAPGTTCVLGWGFRLGLELAGDLGGGPLEGGVSLGLLWKFY